MRVGRGCAWRFLAFVRRLGSQISSPARDGLASESKDVAFFLTSLRRRFGGVKGSLDRGGAGAGLPMGHWLVARVQLLPYRRARRRRPESGSLAPSGHVSSLPALASRSSVAGLRVVLSSVLQAATHARFQICLAVSHRPPSHARAIKLLSAALNYSRATV